MTTKELCYELAMKILQDLDGEWDVGLREKCHAQLARDIQDAINKWFEESGLE